MIHQPQIIKLLFFYYSTSLIVLIHSQLIINKNTFKGSELDQLLDDPFFMDENFSLDENLQAMILKSSYQDGAVRLRGSIGHASMGRVEIYRKRKYNAPSGWGVLCGSFWNQNDAMVVCRQLNYTTGNVIAIRRSNIFGNNENLPIWGNRLECKGTEKNIVDCPGYWIHNQYNSTPRPPIKCPTYARSVAVVCGCQVAQIKNGDRPKCYASVSGVQGYPVDNFYCRYSCLPGYNLVGNPISYCNPEPRWVEEEPRCLSDQEYFVYKAFRNEPCMPNPCLNGGKCYSQIPSSLDKNSKQADFTCECPAGYFGPTCKLDVLPNCGKKIVFPEIQSSFNKPMLRIINGQTAEKNQWPWMAQIKLNNKHICGGVLISPRWVLTAAHCGLKMGSTMKNMTAQSDNWSVTLGHVSQYNPDPKIHQTHKIDFAILQDFTNDHGDMPRKDIALLRLATFVPPQTNINYICLPEKIGYAEPGEKFTLPEGGPIYTDPVPGQTCSVAGWGQLRPDNEIFMNQYNNEIENLLPEYLNYANLTLYSNMRCRSFHTPEHNYLLDNNMMCAGNSRFDNLANAKDACMGDSGGPFMCHMNGKYYVNGIVSFGYICGNRKTPGVYTKVSSYLSWIYRVMEKFY